MQKLIKLINNIRMVISMLIITFAYCIMSKKDRKELKEIFELGCEVKLRTYEEVLRELEKTKGDS